MAITTFKPEMWAPVIAAAAAKNLVYGALCNRDYEGDIGRAGDTVHINAVGDPTIATYTPGTTTISPETLTTADTVLSIDQVKYFAFEVDDVDARQIAGNIVTEALKRAGYGLADTLDQYLVALYTSVDAGNQLGTVAITTADLAYQKLIALKVVLDEANVPQDRRWVVVPPWYEGLLLDNTKFVANPALGVTGSNLLNGHIGRAAGFDVHVSNNNPNTAGDDWLVLAGTPQAITLAEQINKVEAYRPDDAFSDAIKGLHLYGAKVVRPSYLASMVASIT